MLFLSHPVSAVRGRACPVIRGVRWFAYQEQNKLQPRPLRLGVVDKNRRTSSTQNRYSNNNAKNIANRRSRVTCGERYLEGKRSDAEGPDPEATSEGEGTEKPSVCPS